MQATVKILKQLVRIIFGFFAATLAALLVNLVLPPLISASNASIHYFSFSLREFALVASVDWLFLAIAAVVPSLIAVTIAEAIKLRSFIVHVVVGAVFGILFTGHARSVSAWLDLSGGSVQGVTESLVMIIAGAFGGIAYWHFAGKFAGGWREA